VIIFGASRLRAERVHITVARSRVDFWMPGCISEATPRGGQTGRPARVIVSPSPRPISSRDAAARGLQSEKLFTSPSEVNKRPTPYCSERWFSCVTSSSPVVLLLFFSLTRHTDEDVDTKKTSLLIPLYLFHFIFQPIVVCCYINAPYPVRCSFLFFIFYFFRSLKNKCKVGINKTFTDVLQTIDTCRCLDDAHFSFIHI